MSTFGFAFAQPPPRQRKEQARIKALNQAAANKAANKNKPKSEKAVAFDLSSASEGSDGENENMVYGGGNSATSTAVPSPTDDLSCSSADSHSAATSSMSFYEAGGAHSSHSSQGGGLSSGQASSSAGGHVFNTNGVSAASAKRTHLARRGRAASGGGETLASTKTAYSMLNKGAGGGPLTSSAYLQNFIPGNSGVVGGDTTTTSNGGGSSATSTTTSASTATSGGPTVPVGIGGPGGIDTSLEPKPFQPVPSMRTSGHYSNGIAPFSVSAASTSSSSSGFSSVRGGGPGSYNNPDTAPIMLQSHSAASTGSKFHPSTSYPGSNSGGGNMISNPLLTNHLIPGNKKNANVLTRAGEYLLLNLTAMTTHEERKRVRDLGRITDPQLAIEMFFHRGHLQSILLLWRRRGSESDISRLCLAALEHCAQVIGVHAAKTRQASSGAPRYVYNGEGKIVRADAVDHCFLLLEMFREFQVPNYIFWSLEIHFYRREHQTVALSFLSTLLGLGNACSGAAGPSGGINSGGRSITSSSSTATTEPAGAQATGLFTRYLQDFIGTEYPDLDSFSEIMTPPTVATTQSCYVIGHLVRGKVSGMHMLLLILRELVLRVSDSHNAANGSFALLKNQPASSSEFLGQQHASADHVNVVEAAASNVVAGGRGPGANNSNINWRVELCAAVFPLLVKVLENHKANRILFLAEKGLELLCKSARQGFNLVKSDTSGVWGSALGGQAGSAKGKDSIADKHVLSTGALFLNSYFKLLLDFNAWFETLHEHTVYTDHYGSDDVGFPPEGGAKRGCSSTMTAAREGQHQHQALIGDHGDGGDLDLPQAPQSSSSEMAAPLGVPISSSRHQHPHHSGSMQLFPPIKLANARYHTRNSNGTGVASHNGLLQHPQQQHSSSSSSSHHPQQQHSSSSSHTAHHQHNKLLAALSNAPSTPPRNGRVASFDSTFCHVKNLFPSPLIDSPNGSPSPLKVWSDSSDDEEALRSYLPGKAVASKVTAPSHHNRAGAFHSSKRTKKLAQMARQPDVHDLPNLMMSPTDKKIKDALNNFMGDHDGEELLHAVDYSSCNAGAVGVTSTTDEPPMAAMSPTAELLDDLKKQRQIDALVHISQFRDQRSLSRRFQDRLRRLPGGARFIYETLQVYLISLVQHENKFLHQLLTVLAMILDGNRKNCKHFVEKYAGLNLLISVFSLYKDYVEGGTQDGMRGDEEGHPFHAPQKSLEEIVAARPDAIPFLQSNFLNFAIVCEAMPIRTQNLLLQPLNAYLDISERQSGEIKMLPPSRKQHSKTGGPKAAQQLQVYQQTNRSSQTRLQFLLNFIDDFYFSPAIQGMSCHFLVKFLYGRPFVQQSDPANLDVAVAPATAPTVDLIDVYGGEIRRKRKAALARGGNQRDGDGNLPVGLGGCIPTSRAFNGNEEEVDLAMASAMKSISPDTRRRLFSYLLDLFLTNVDNFPNDFAVVGHALHAAKLLLDADEEFRVTCTDSIELAKESAFNLPANERLQTRMLEMALPVLLRHIGHKHTGPMSKGAPGASSSRGMVEATKGGGGGGEQLYPRGAQSRSNTAIEYGLELVLLCPLERTIKAAKLLDIHLPTVLSNIIRENCVDVRLLFQVEKMHRRIETRFEKERKADFVKHKQTRWSKLAEYCEEEDAEMLSLVKDLVRADEQLFAAASSGASDQTRNAGDQGRKGSGYDDPKAAQAPKVIDESRKLRGRMASFDLEL